MKHLKIKMIFLALAVLLVISISSTVSAANNTTNNRTNFTDRQIQPAIGHVNTTANGTVLIRQGTLIGRAVIPAETFIPGPTSGQHLGVGPINNVTVPFVNKQPVQGISAILSMRNGTFLAMSDNGFGSAANSPDYILTVYNIRPDFKTGNVELLGFTRLKDPNRLINFSIQNENTTARYLTGRDFDPESFRIAPDGTWWFGDEFGPFIFQTNSNGVILRAPIMIPGVMSPENPFLKPGQTHTLPRSSGFEGMAISTDGTKLYPMLERALIGDPQNRRIIFEFCLINNKFTGRRFFYRMAEGHMTGEMTAINKNEFIVIERDGRQGAAAVYKQLYVMNMSKIDAEGYVTKRKIADLMDIANPNLISLPGRAGDIGLGNPFSFPFVTIEAVDILDPYTLVVTNDNNFPFSRGRNPVHPDNTEIIKIRLREALGLEPTKPISSPRGGNFYNNATVNLTSTGGFAPVRIFFTTDGRTPTNASRVFNGTPLVFNTTTTLRFFAQDRFGTNSTVSTETYNIYRQVAYTYPVRVPVMRWVRRQVRGRRRWVRVRRYVTEYRTGTRRGRT